MVIISASRRTDLPAFYPEWTISKILEMSGSEQTTLFPTKNETAVVFWTKNARPIMRYLPKIKNIPYYFQYTVNNYGKLEPSLPTIYDRIDTFKILSKTIGKKRVIWRFDPFLTCGKYNITVNSVLKSFEQIGDEIYPYTNKLVFSFLDTYPKLPYWISTPTVGERQLIINSIIDCNKKWKLDLATCAEITNYNEIKQNKCIDPDLLRSLGVEISKDYKDPDQRALCNCYPSTDIGEYNTCKHGCVYCYANKHNI